ncbi:MAG: 3-hydroxyacyl-ACP dehydratase FabZ [Candidatus Sumerlaeota bacterium]|nr:3-hydroxyacyl-ACP dehydratase FabZ [Candidatus Sumerlaeota bacterium]
MHLNQEQIAELIPHRYPFLFLDAVTAYEPGKAIDGYKLVSANEPFFQGHFPGKPIMPGVIITEALAQLTCVFLSLELGETAKTMTPLFLAIDKAKFRAMVVPGHRLDLRVELLQMRRGIAKVNVVARVNGEMAVEAELTCMMQQKARNENAN